MILRGELPFVGDGGRQSRCTSASRFQGLSAEYFRYGRWRRNPRRSPGASTSKKRDVVLFVTSHPERDVTLLDNKTGSVTPVALSVHSHRCHSQAERRSSLGGTSMP